MNHNHAGFQARLAFVRVLLRERFNFEVVCIAYYSLIHNARAGLMEDFIRQDEADVAPVQYDPESPFKYNNFVYRVTKNSPISGHNAARRASLSPGCVPIPEGTRELIVRLANPDTEGMGMENRVENEVAIILLASAALSHSQPRVVPHVYGWGSAAGKSDQGWIVQEVMPGSPLCEAFEGMGFDQKKKIFAQMAELLKGLQSYQLPASITGFGGVTFDGSGRIVSAAMPTVGAGPWDSYEASFKARLEMALRKADANPYIRGWRGNGLRDRLDKFVAEGVPAQFASLSLKQDRVIIHADFNTSNLLFDPETGRITGLIDYDFASILHPSYEFLRSFDRAGGQFRGWYVDEESEEAALREAKLHGFPSPLPATKPDGAVNWEDAKAWEDALEAAGVRRPRTMRGIDKVADVDTVLQAILPWRVSNADVLRLQTEQTIMKCRDENEEHLDKLLRRLGF